MAYQLELIPVPQQTDLSGLVKRRTAKSKEKKKS